MAIELSATIDAKVLSDGRSFSVRGINLEPLGKTASPVLVLDRFHVTGRPFSPHPHAGFSPVTYVLDDSPGELRSRDSLGNDLITGPGGLVWTQAGSGIIHEELPASPRRELRGIQLFVNLSARNKLSAPRMFRIAGDEVPVWCNDSGDRIRVVVGAYEGVASPLIPPEPFSFLDARIVNQVSFNLIEGHNAIAFVLDGAVVLEAANQKRRLTADQAMALSGDGAVTLKAHVPAHLLILSGRRIDEPIVSEGPFIMNDSSQIRAANQRYLSGTMGRLVPAS